MGDELTEKYVKLLCKFAPEDVYPFLVKAPDCRYPECLEIVRPYKVSAPSFLLVLFSVLRTFLCVLLFGLRSS